MKLSLEEVQHIADIGLHVDGHLAAQLAFVSKVLGPTKRQRHLGIVPLAADRLN